MNQKGFRHHKSSFLIKSFIEKAFPFGIFSYLCNVQSDWTININMTKSTDKQIAAAAAEFAERWKGKGYERGQSQLFWADLLTNVFGVENGDVQFQVVSGLRHEPA